MTEPRTVGSVGHVAETHSAPDLTAILRRRWRYPVLGALSGLLVAQMLTWMTPPSYEARATLLLIAAPTEASPGGGRARTLDVDTWATVARSTELLQDVSTELGLEFGVVQERTSAAAASTGDILVLSSEAPSADQAVREAEVYSAEFLQSREETLNAGVRERVTRLEDLQATLSEELDVLANRIRLEEEKGADASAGLLATLETSQAVALERLASASSELDAIEFNTEVGRVVVQPSTAVTRTGLSSAVVSLSGLLVGGLIGLILALVRDRYDDRYRSVEPLEEFGIEEIARIRYPSDVKDDSSSSAATPSTSSSSDSYGRLVARLAFVPDHMSDEGRSALIVAVESSTLPVDTADRVSAELCDRARASGLAATTARIDRLRGVSARPNASSTSSHEAIAKLRANNDLVLIPQRPLDEQPLGLTLARTADVTVLLVTDDTSASRFAQTLQDLAGIGTGDIKIICVSTRHGLGAVFPHRRTPASEAPADGTQIA